VSVYEYPLPSSPSLHPPSPPHPHRYNKTKSRKFDRLVLAVSVGLSFFFFFLKTFLGFGKLIQRFLWAIFWLVASCEPCKLYLNFQVQVSFFPFLFYNLFLGYIVISTQNKLFHTCCIGSVRARWGQYALFFLSLSLFLPLGNV